MNSMLDYLEGLVEYFRTKRRFGLAGKVLYVADDRQEVVVIDNIRFARPEGSCWCWVYDITIIGIVLDANGWIRTGVLRQITTVPEEYLRPFETGEILGPATAWAHETT